MPRSNAHANVRPTHCQCRFSKQNINDRHGAFLRHTAVAVTVFGVELNAANDVKANGMEWDNESFWRLQP